MDCAFSFEVRVETVGCSDWPIIGHPYQLSATCINSLYHFSADFQIFIHISALERHSRLRLTLTWRSVLWLCVADLELQFWMVSELYAYTPDALLLLRDFWPRATISSMFDNASNTNLLTIVHKHARAGKKIGSHVVAGTISQNCVVASYGLSTHTTHMRQMHNTHDV